MPRTGRDAGVSSAMRILDGEQNLAPRRPWLRFQWRLTLLYVIVSVLTVLTIQTVVSLYQIYLYVYSPAITDGVLQEMEEAEPAAARYFAGGEVDIAGLTRFLDQRKLDEEYPGARLMRGYEPPGNTYIVITRPDGSVLAATPDREPFPPSEKLDASCTPEERLLLEGARRGVKSARRIGGRVIGAAPIHREGAVVALAFVRSGKYYTLQNAVRGSVASLLTNAVVTAIGGIIVGGLFGYMTARSWNRRLQRIAAAAEQWAAGDLKAAAPEKPADEFGMLGRRLNRMAAELEQVISLRRRVAVLEERQRITRDLHDTVKQQAFATSMLLGSAQARLENGDAAGVRAALDQAGDLAHRMQEELRSILKEYRAAIALPLPETLKRLTADWEQQAGISIRLAVAPASAELTPAISEAISHIVQEALANACRHSGASEVDVTLVRDAEGWRLSVSDNGKGFDIGSGRGAGLGLNTMRERAEELPRGRFAIHSAPGDGTRVDVRFQEARKS